MSDNPSSIKPPLRMPQPGEPILTALQSAEISRRLMALEKQVLPDKPERWEPPRMVKITERNDSFGGLGAAWEYGAVEVYWNDGTWTERTGGIDYSLDGTGGVFEVRQNINVPIDTIVQVFQIEADSSTLPAGDNRTTRWIFEYNEVPDYMPFAVEVRGGAYPDQIVVGRLRATLAEGGDWIEGRKVHVDGEGGFAFRGSQMNRSIAEFKTITEDCWLYYHIDMANETVSLETVALKVNQLPGGASSEDVNWPLAYIKWDSTNNVIERVNQLHFGRIWVQWWRDPSSISECSINHQASFLELVNDQTITELDATGASRLVYGFQNSGNVRGWAEMEDVLGDVSVYALGGITNTRRTS